MSKPKYLIEQWSLHKTPDNRGFWLQGFIKGRHPFIFETEPAHTSLLISINFEDMIAETMNSVYMLGEDAMGCRNWKAEDIIKEADRCE